MIPVYQYSATGTGRQFIALMDVRTNIRVRPPAFIDELPYAVQIAARRKLLPTSRETPPLGQSIPYRLRQYRATAWRQGERTKATTYVLRPNSDPLNWPQLPQEMVQKVLRRRLLPTSRESPPLGGGLPALYKQRLETHWLRGERTQAGQTPLNGDSYPNWPRLTFEAQYYLRRKILQFGSDDPFLSLLGNPLWAQTIETVLARRPDVPLQTWLDALAVRETVPQELPDPFLSLLGNPLAVQTYLVALRQSPDAGIQFLIAYLNANKLSPGGGVTPVSDDDIWWRRARKARAGTYLLYDLEEQRKQKRKLFKRFSRSGDS